MTATSPPPPSWEINHLPKSERGPSLRPMHAFGDCFEF